MALDRDTQRSRGSATPASRCGRPGGLTILFDPWFGNPQEHEHADAVDRCDILLVTHGHGDHFGDAQQIATRLGRSGRASTSCPCGWAAACRAAWTRWPA